MSEQEKPRQITGISYASPQVQGESVVIDLRSTEIEIVLKSGARITLPPGSQVLWQDHQWILPDGDPAPGQVLTWRWPDLIDPK